MTAYSYIVNMERTCGELTHWHLSHHSMHTQCNPSAVHQPHAVQSTARLRAMSCVFASCYMVCNPPATKLMSGVASPKLPQRYTASADHVPGSMMIPEANAKGSFQCPSPGTPLACSVVLRCSEIPLYGGVLPLCSCIPLYTHMYTCILTSH